MFRILPRLAGGLLLAAFLAGEGAALATDGPAGGPQWFAITHHWRIRRDATLGGCFAMNVFNEDSLLRVGLNAATENGYIMLGNGTWQTLSPGEKYPVVLKFGKNEPLAGEAGVIAMGESRLLMMALPGEQLLAQFGGSRELDVSSGGKHIMTMDLSGAKYAVAEIQRCQKVGDPFAG
jgi:hypothetical protein